MCGHQQGMIIICGQKPTILTQGEKLMSTNSRLSVIFSFKQKENSPLLPQLFKHILIFQNISN